MTHTGVFPEIDWNRPWLRIYRDLGASLLTAPDWQAAMNQCAEAAGLRNHRQQPIRFVAQAELPRETPYEAFISRTGLVPTRDNLHDFFNGLVWLTFPLIKAELNRLQAAQIAQLGVGQARGAARDAATIFDENAALLITTDAQLAPGLRAHQWQRAFLQGRAAFLQNAEACLFGHALMEKLVTPYKAITAHAWVLNSDAGYFALAEPERLKWIDCEIASMLAQQELSTADFTPLPVLGVPGWWEGQDEAFYADSRVFRPKRKNI
jgi:hypothetical protein